MVRLSSRILRPELQPQLKTRTVSVAGIRLDSREFARPFKGIICADICEFESFSIGAGWCQALSDCSVDLVSMSFRRVLASLRDRHLGRPMMGSGGCGGPIYRGVLAVRLTAGIRTRNGLAPSIVPAGTSLHRSAEFTVSPVAFYCARLAVRYMSVTNVHWRHARSCLLGRAERSSPKAAQRCAAGAGLDGERAHRAIIRAVAMRTTIRRSRSRRRRLLSCSSETRCHPPTCDA